MTDRQPPTEQEWTAVPHPPLPPVAPEDRAWYRRLRALCVKAQAELAAKRESAA